MARYGGEEFLVVLPAALAERMRRAVEAAVVDVGPGRRAKVTATFGAAGTDIVGYDRTRLLRAADRALYRGKQAGRNRVASASARERHPDWTTHAADSVLRSPQAAD